ncbi:MAG: hypothetical protein ACKOEX_06950 [Planctomycetia bacterium]
MPATAIQAGSACRKGPMSLRRTSLSRGGRRRHIDPVTCERDYAPDELEFMRALEAYKRASGRTFPTCSEILEVVRSLGYVRSDAV